MKDIHKHVPQLLTRINASTTRENYATERRPTISQPAPTTFSNWLLAILAWLAPALTALPRFLSVYLVSTLYYRDLLALAFFVDMFLYSIATITFYQGFRAPGNEVFRPYPWCISLGSNEPLAKWIYIIPSQLGGAGLGSGRTTRCSDLWTVKIIRRLW